MLYMYTTNIDQIRPDDHNSFDPSGLNLSSEGYEIYWKAISACIKRIDTGCMKPIK